MVKGTEHFRVPLRSAQELEKEVRGATAGFNTPLFVVDTPGGKRDVHSAEFYEREQGVSGFVAPAVPGRIVLLLRSNPVALRDGRNGTG